MSAIPARVAQELGRRLRAAGFQPLPDVDADGELIGTRPWRVRAGYVEYLALRPSGLAHAVRAEATFDYQRPTEHGPVMEHRSGHAVNALGWLLTSAEAPSGDLARPTRRLTRRVSRTVPDERARGGRRMAHIGPRRHLARLPHRPDQHQMPALYQALCDHSVPARYLERAALRVFRPACLVLYDEHIPDDRHWQLGG